MDDMLIGFLAANCTLIKNAEAGTAELKPMFWLFFCSSLAAWLLRRG